MKNVLIITYFFPPIGGAGVQRTLKFVKYLPEFNYNPIILTPNPNLIRYHAYDYTLLKEIPQNLKIYRTFIIDLNWIFKIFYGVKLNKLVTFINDKLLFPDYQKQWLPFAKRKIKKILKKEKIDAVFITSPPHSVQALGKWIKRRYKLPVISDFRDPLTFNYKNKDKATFDKCFMFEKEVLDNSDFIIANTEINKTNYIKHFRIADNKFKVITNGFDKDDFINIELSQRKKEKIIFSHIGQFYGEHNATPLIYAIKDIKDKLTSVEFRFIGSVTNADKILIEKFKLNEFIKLIDYTNHKKALEYGQESDYLLLILTNKNWNYCIPGKTFEYINTNKEILAIVPKDGCCAEIVKKTGTGVIVDPESIEDIKTAIQNFVNNKPYNYNPNNDLIKTFERKSLTKNLTDVFNHVINQHLQTK